MRILWTHNFSATEPNGQLFIETTSRGLRARGVDVSFEYLGNLRSVTNLIRARKRIRQISPEFDLVHAQYGSACALATAAASGTPKVLTIRGSDWNAHRTSFGFHYLHNQLARRMTGAALDSFDCVLTVSNRMATAIQHVRRGSRVVTVPTPVDLDRFVPRDKRAARAALGFPDSQEKWVLFNALYVDDPNKRFALARRAFELASSRYENLRLCVATDLPHADLPLFTAACDVILCTSGNEGWPNSVKEALACDVPFVATDVSDLRQIASQEPGCRVCDAEPEALAKNLCEVISLGQQRDLRKHVLSMGLDQTSGRLVEIYESLLAKH